MVDSSPVVSHGPTARPARLPVPAAIREGILRGEFVPGQRLVEADLSEQFEASRAAVRSALVELATEGLVERVANRGARVRVVPLEEAIEIYEVRMVLEALCAAKAAERADDAEVAELRGIGTDMEEAVAAGEVMVYRQLNERLHRRIREMSGQRTAGSVLERLRAQSVRQQFKVATTPGRPKVSLPEHLAIIDAICRHDAVAADAALREHLRSVMDAMRSSHAG
ncbi:GntR family transcriptional regulator [Marmoricola endophyticus]|uniref:GntR family transcriptional regulator n=1 Tax=Marmoricola endophyticus TaxID=2040280 RepID=A0A917BHT0_9ACTN|nr:GntR family transcriptional regulator [Marmoricola endophyticus]